MRDRIAVVGGGIGALSLALECGVSGLDGVVFAEQPLAQYASTRNQGWLQSGALYAGNRGVRTALECVQGSHEIQALAPEAVASGTPCFFLFDDEVDRERFAAGCREVAIPAWTVGLEEVSKVSGVTPAGYRSALRTLDAPMDASLVLRRIAGRAEVTGTRFVEADLRELRLERRDRSWLVSWPGGREEVSAVVLACGPLLTSLLSSLGFDAMASQYVTTKIEVVSVGSVEPPRAMLIGGAGGVKLPNVVPFHTGAGGFTVALSQGDVVADASDEDVRKEAEVEIERVLQDRFPDLHALGNRRSHVCHKIALREPAPGEGRRHIIERIDGGLWFFYPGKFTTALIAARQLLARLSDNGPRINAQPYAI